MNYKIEKVKSPEGVEYALAIRRIVFIEGQDVPEELEVDGLDEQAQHYLVWDGQMPIATARVRFIGSVAKIERVAVLDGYQGQGIGKRLMSFILDDLKENREILQAKLGSQMHALAFYEKLGFKKIGNEYMDAGIPHFDMVMDL